MTTGAPVAEISYVKMVFELLGGLALFIWGMEIMGDGLQKAAGDRLRYIIEKLTKKPVYGVAVGTIVTGLIQSSSAVTVMLVGFVNAGLMNLSQAAGIIFGANIGTTVTAQLVAFNIEIVIMPAIFLGFVMKMFGTKKIWRVTGEVILGFGVLFLGMQFISSSVAFVKSDPNVVNLLATLSGNLFLGILAGLIFTGIIQSSSATSGLVIALIGNGLITLPGGVAIMMGANIGTCVTALLASIGGNVGARRVAVAHIMFNVIGVTLFIPIINWVIPLIEWTSVSPARQVANFHTFFNVTMALLITPFTAYYVKFIKYLVKGEEILPEYGIKFISDKLLVTPSLALEQATQEMVRMMEIAKGMVRRTFEMVKGGNKRLFKFIMDNENTVDSLQMAITAYLTKLTQKSLSEDQAERAIVLLHVVHDVERIGDHATNLAELADGMIEQKIIFSKEANESLVALFEKVDDACKLVQSALAEYDKKKAILMYDLEEEIDRMAQDVRDQHVDRLKAEQCKPENGIFFLDMASNLERIGDHCLNIAQAVLGQTGGKSS